MPRRKRISEEHYQELTAQPITVAVTINPISGRVLSLASSSIPNGSRELVARVFHILAAQLSEDGKEEGDVDS